MTNSHPIEGLMTTAMENLKQIVDVNTIIGEPIQSPDGSTIITVSKVGFGFAAGGSEFGQVNSKSDSDQSSDESEQSYPFGGGSGGGVTITPIGFLVANKQGVQMIHLHQNANLYEKMVEVAPQALDKVKEILSNNQKGKETSD
ncbi:putative spore protein YtfJ [Paraliobacillus ryukyuensis]|uniref:Sporulation protein YtfJ n=1 Tax=Paraliobacillus ryukyuensis TaxID=200904 RepID=A0A366EAC7_9BACI|nr:GerW family sporulation protein [Paraliobacillus ryukyuensis]RBO99380.1 sporulation protein YtfJ [Paraliobacillus ryukyuensis]